MPVCGNYLFFELPKKIVLNPKDGHIDIYMFPMINFLKNLQRKGGFFYEQIQAFRCFYFKFRSCTST